LLPPDPGTGVTRHLEGLAKHNAAIHNEAFAAYDPDIDRGGDLHLLSLALDPG
jgi:hypothetical protein